MDLVEFVKSMSVGDVGFPGLLTLAIYLILSGKLVPRSVVEDVRADRDARIAAVQEDRDTWKEAYQISESGRDKQNSVLEILLEYAKTSDHLIRSVQQKISDEGK
jgi:hypothetical protein